MLPKTLITVKFLNLGKAILPPQTFKGISPKIILLLPKENRIGKVFKNLGNYDRSIGSYRAIKFNRKLY